MSSMLGQPVVVENRAGAGGLIGINVRREGRTPDGYTIAIAPSSGLAMNVTLRDDMPFHPLKDLALLTQIVSVPEILVVNEKVPANTLAELVALAKAQPGKLTFASTGPGGMPHMAMELLEAHRRDRARACALHRRGARRERSARRPCADDVRRRAGADGLDPAGNAARAGDRQQDAHRHVPSDVRPRPSSACRKVEADNWYGLVAPAATPKPVLDKLYAAATEALHSADVKDKLAAQGVIAVGNPSAEFRAYVQREIDRWGEVIKATGIKIK